jgi:site-specific recombinase XerD
MKANHTFSINYWLYRSKEKNGKAPIYCRITMNGQRIEMSMKRVIEPSKWIVGAGVVKGNSEEARTINHYLETIKADLYKKYNQLLILGNPIYLDDIKNSFLGVKEEKKGLIEIFTYHNDQMKLAIGIEVVKATHTKFETVKKKLIIFLNKKYHKKEIVLDELNNKFIIDFEYYLKVEEKIAHNTVMKYIRNVKKVINMAIANEWLKTNPFSNFKCSTKKVIREILTQTEIDKIALKNLDIERLDEVRDIFLFCCYTGYAFVDVEALTVDDVVIGIDGVKWIHTHRKKTGTQSNVPLLMPALQIIEKYKNHPCQEIQQKLLPVKSNQKMNAYLKEIAALCNINKPLTMHIARHTFATTITLSNNVPIETVSKLLGHTKLATTQIYAQVLDTKISKDMLALSKQFEISNNNLKIAK